jgi:hypothetical protein
LKATKMSYFGSYSTILTPTTIGIIL